MKRPLFKAYLVALHLALVAVIFKTDIRHRAAARMGLPVSAERPFISAVRQIHSQMDASIPAGSTIFLGDSITMALATAAVAPSPVNLGIGSQRSDHLIESMRLYKSLQRARAVVISVGVNDLLENREAGLEDRYRAILQNVPASVRVVMSSVTPTTKVAKSRQIAARDAAEKTCSARPGCTFVDALELLWAAPAALLPDGIHLTADGYALWIPALRTAAQ